MLMLKIHKLIQLVEVQNETQKDSLEAHWDKHLELGTILQGEQLMEKWRQCVIIVAKVLLDSNQVELCIC